MMAHGFGDELPSWMDKTDISRLRQKTKRLGWRNLVGD